MTIEELMVYLIEAKFAVRKLEDRIKEVQGAPDDDAMFMAELCARKAQLELGYVDRYLRREKIKQPKRRTK